MDGQRWQQIDRVLQAAQELVGDERRHFLDVACAADEDLRQEVESLLAASQQEDNYLSLPAIEVAAQMLAHDLSERETAEMKNAPDNKSPNPPFAATNHSAPVKLAAGDVLDNRYLLERELGRGGMGVVFLAQDRKLPGTQVVIKVLLEEHQHLSDPLKQSIGLWLKQKFNDEKNALARIRHPGVVRALDVGELPGGHAYLVMEYVPGEPLRKSILPAGMELRRAARLIQQIAQALAAAHEQGVIHRDLKPENILRLEVDGVEQIRLIDFGIATVRDAMSAALPHTTQVAGTGAYMAPEQLRGNPEAASDIYALSVIAYELVTGQRPSAA